MGILISDQAGTQIHAICVAIRVGVCIRIGVATCTGVRVAPPIRS